MCAPPTDSISGFEARFALGFIPPFEVYADCNCGDAAYKESYTAHREEFARYEPSPRTKFTTIWEVSKPP